MPAAVILAGGRGERLGGAIKSEIEVGGVRLLDRVAARLAGCAPILVAHGRLDPALLDLPDGLTPVPDLDGDYAGPLAGYAGAVAYLADKAERPPLLVSVAVDTPFLPADFVERLQAELGHAAAGLAAYDGQLYPTNAIWRLDRFVDLPARVAAGTAPRSLKALGAMASAITVEWPAHPDGDPFANVNTPVDLADFERRAKARGAARS